MMHTEEILQLITTNSIMVRAFWVIVRFFSYPKTNISRFSGLILM